MNLLTLTEANFDTVVAQSPCLVVEFSADAADFRDRALRAGAPDAVAWGHVDVRTQARVAATFGIQADVALLVFRDGIVLYLESGRHDADRIAALVGQVIALDMPAIRSEMAAQKQAEVALHMRRLCPAARRA